MLKIGFGLSSVAQFNINGGNHHLQRTWKGAILPLLVPSVNLQHESKYNTTEAFNFTIHLYEYPKLGTNYQMHSTVAPSAWVQNQIMWDPTFQKQSAFNRKGKGVGVNKAPKLMILAFKQTAAKLKVLTPMRYICVCDMMSVHRLSRLRLMIRWKISKNK